ncbi:cytochrome P450 [Phaeosphaeriaceae sp. PMI808]|nr:cytochrome P450 [Phaeosphaeriaceae sp. PMI808]
MFTRDGFCYPQLTQRLGPVVRVAPNRLVFNSASAIQDIYNNPRVTKGHAYIQLRTDTRGAPSLLNTLDKEMHRQKRKIIAPVVSERSMRVFEPYMSQQIDTFLLQLLQSSRRNDTVNMSPRCERLSVDIVGELAFGYPLNTQTDPTHRAIVEGIKARGARSSLYYFWERIRALDPLFEKIRGRQSTEGFYASLKTMIGARMSIPKDAKHDFFALATGEIAPGEPGLISKELWAEAVFFIAAGGSTTATAMSGVFFYLSCNPNAYTRLAAEIRSTFPSGRDIRQGPQLGSSWREQDPISVTAGEPFVVDGYVIPPGSQVALSNYTLQHDPSYFPEPYEFRPERWLAPEDGTPETADQQDARTAMRRAFAPFSVGDRSCAGKPMAYLEISLTIARAVWYFDFQKASGEAGKLGEGLPGRTDGRGRRDEFQLYEGVVVGHNGPNLVFTPREEYWRELEANQE